MHFQKLILAFRGWIHLNRWATVVFSIPEVRKVERPMRLFFDKRKFQGADAKQREETLSLASDVHDGVTSPFYWAYLIVQEMIAEIERKCTMFPELCLCHCTYIMRIECTVNRATALSVAWSSLSSRKSFSV